MSTTRVVVITGGGSGIGKAIAAAFAGRGDRVVIIGRRSATLQATGQELGSHVTWFAADVSKREQVEKVVAQIVDQVGGIDVLINNAGIFFNTTTSMPLVQAEEAWDMVLGTNLKGSFLMTMAAAPHMPQPGGRIISISSIAAFTGSSIGSIAYAAAKAGLLGMTNGIARELSPKGITVNSIAPGFIAHTELTEYWSEHRVQALITETPLGRAGSGEDIAEAAIYLASPEASFITGEVLHVNGGRLFGH